MYQYLKNNNYNLTATDEYILAEGDIPICLVAHLDTVEKIPPRNIFFDNENKVMWSPELLGADDRAGVYAIIQIIESGYRPHIILTTDEEIGAVGATALVKQIPKCPLENLKAIFQLDRHGSNDCVFYDCDNPDFTKYVESFGFDTAYGSFSDISVIAPEWGIAAVNLSVGYYNEHQKIEYLRFDELHQTIEKVKMMLDNVEEMESYKYIEAKRVNNFWNMSSNLVDYCLICYQPIKKKKYKMIKEHGYCYNVCNKCYKAYYD